MARYYCEYCHSYLTHDTLSVRKSHLVGKNHLRITADYYRNKARDEVNRGIFRRKKSYHQGNGKEDGDSSKSKTIIHCLCNKDKKLANKLSRVHKKELENWSDYSSNETSILSKLYDGSPGYSKVFIDTNRLDIGDLVRSNKLPQRANATQMNQGNNVPLSSSINTVRTRNETILQSSTENPYKLEPPRILTQWNNTVPKNSIYYGSRLLRTVITESKKRIIGNTNTNNQSNKRRKF